MTTDKETRSPQGCSTNERNGPKGHASKSRDPETGTEEPLDDQPQREDEYLSTLLKEFNPQRKDKKTPLPDAESVKEIKPGRTEDKT